MTFIPAVVTISDLPNGTTLTGTEIFEAVQTTNSVGKSIQVTANQLIGLGTTIAGLSVLGNANAGSGPVGPITGTADQVMIVNHAGSSALFGAVNLATSAAVTGVLPVANGGTNTSSLTAFGSIYANGSTAMAATAAGSTGQVLVSQGSAAAPVWSGGMVLVNTLSPNNVAVATDTTSLTSTYRNYMITFENLCPTGSAALLVEMATSGSNFITGNYVSMSQVLASGLVAAFTNTTAGLLSGNNASTVVSTSTAYGLNGFIKIFNPASSTFRKQYTGETSYLNAEGASGTTTISNATVNGWYDGNNNPITGVQFFFSGSFNIQTGTIRIYGLA